MNCHLPLLRTKERANGAGKYVSVSVSIAHSLGKQMGKEEEEGKNTRSKRRRREAVLRKIGTGPGPPRVLLMLVVPSPLPPSVPNEWMGLDGEISSLLLLSTLLCIEAVKQGGAYILQDHNEEEGLSKGREGVLQRLCKLWMECCAPLYFLSQCAASDCQM